MFEPIGKILHIEEDSKGLYFVSKLSDTKKANDAYRLLKDGVIDEFSIGYDTIDSKYDKFSNTRYLKKVKLWEISVVSFAANENARLVDPPKCRHNDLNMLSRKTLNNNGFDSFINCTCEMPNDVITMSKALVLTASLDLGLKCVPDIIFYRDVKWGEICASVKNSYSNVVAPVDAMAFVSRFDDYPKIYIKRDYTKRLQELILHECMHCKAREVFDENALVKNKQKIEFLCENYGKLYI
jgi:hypothetical protein